VFIDAKARAYLSITARARVMRDIAKIAQVWRKSDAVWWPGGPSDPNVCLLQIEPLTAELWDGPSSAARTAFEFAKAGLPGEEPSLGANRKVTVALRARLSAWRCQPNGLLSLYRPIRVRLGFQPSCAKRSYAFCTASLP